MGTAASANSHGLGSNGQRARGPKPTLSRDEIARIAIGIADAHGIEAVSMQQVARGAGVTTMALYRYFSKKTQLIELMVEIAGGPAPRPGRHSQSWRTGLTQWVRQCAGIYRNHPWFLEAASARPRRMGPNELAWLEAALVLLQQTGLAVRDQHKTFLLLVGHIRSHAEFSVRSAKSSETRNWLPDLRRMLEANPAPYPALLAAIDCGAFGHSGQQGLLFGLECILDGIAAQASKTSEPLRNVNTGRSCQSGDS